MAGCCCCRGPSHRWPCSRAATQSAVACRSPTWPLKRIWPPPTRLQTRPKAPQKPNWPLCSKRSNAARNAVRAFRNSSGVSARSRPKRRLPMHPFGAFFQYNARVKRVTAGYLCSRSLGGPARVALCARKVVWHCLKNRCIFAWPAGVATGSCLMKAVAWYTHNAIFSIAGCARPAGAKG